MGLIGGSGESPLPGIARVSLTGSDGLSILSGSRIEVERTVFWIAVGNGLMPEKRQQVAALQTRTRVSKTDEPIARSAGAAHSREIWRGAGDRAGAAAED